MLLCCFGCFVRMFKTEFVFWCCTVELLLLLQCYNILADVYLSNVKIKSPNLLTISKNYIKLLEWICEVVQVNSSNLWMSSPPTTGLQASEWRSCSHVVHMFALNSYTFILFLKNVLFSVSVMEVECVLEGCQSETFRQMVGSMPEGHSLTVVFKGPRKSLDLLCQNQEEARCWARGIRTLQEHVENMTQKEKLNQYPFLFILNWITTENFLLFYWYIHG